MILVYSELSLLAKSSVHHCCRAAVVGLAAAASSLRRPKRSVLWAVDGVFDAATTSFSGSRRGILA